MKKVFRKVLAGSVMACMMCVQFYGSSKLGFFMCFRGPSGLAKLRKICRIRFHCSWNL